jgi:cytochrome c peroxidase
MSKSRQNLAVALLLAAAGVAGIGVFAQAQDRPPTARELAAMKSEYKRSPPRPVENQAVVDLGRLLFWDPRVSASGTMACVTCHLPYVAWAVTERRSRNDSGKLTSRKSQPLIGLGHVGSSALGWDGRNASLEAQAKASIATGSMSMRETPTPVKVEVIEQRIQAIPEYVAKFNAALPDAAINLETMAKALAAYQRSIEPGLAPFDNWIDGDETAISESAKRGFALFNTKGNCSACHGGWRFTDDNFHDIGTSTTDRGRGRELKDDPLMQFAFKTPTLRSVALRPPYMHNGMAATLYDAVKHYEKGGIDRPSRSPMMLPLQLTEQERRDLVAFMQTLSGLPEGEDAPPLPGMK